MFLFIGKLILIFLIFITAIRLLGKSALAQLTPHDFGAIIFLAYLSFGSIKVEGMTRGIIGVAVLTIVHFLVSRFNLFNPLNRLIIGKPTILIKHGEVIPLNLKQSRYPLVELLSSIRAAGYPDIQDIEYAILEPNGEISVLPKKELVPVTPKHLKMDVDYRGLPIVVVIEGKIQQKNLTLIDKDELWLKKELQAKGYERIDNIFYAFVLDTDHSLTVKLKTDE